MPDEITKLTSNANDARGLLRPETEQTGQKATLRDRVAAAKSKARQIGSLDPDFDMKKFADECHES